MGWGEARKVDEVKMRTWALTCTGCFSSNDGEFHVFDLDSNEKKVNLTNDNIFEMITITPQLQRVKKKVRFRESSRFERDSLTEICCTRIQCVGNLQSQLPSWLSCYSQVAFDMNVPIGHALSPHPPSALRPLLEQNTWIWEWKQMACFISFGVSCSSDLDSVENRREVSIDSQRRWKQRQVYRSLTFMPW